LRRRFNDLECKPARGDAPTSAQRNEFVSCTEQCGWMAKGPRPSDDERDNSGRPRFLLDHVEFMVRDLKRRFHRKLSPQDKLDFSKCAFIIANMWTAKLRGKEQFSLRYLYQDVVEEDSGHLLQWHRIPGDSQEMGEMPPSSQQKQPDHDQKRNGKAKRDHDDDADGMYEDDVSEPEYSF